MTIKSEVFVEYLYLTPHLSPQSILTVKFILPTDVVLADKFAADANTKVVSVENIPDGWMGLDNGVCTYTYMDTCVCTHTWITVCVCVCVHTWITVCTDTRAYTHMMCVCMCGLQYA